MSGVDVNGVEIRKAPSMQLRDTRRQWSRPSAELSSIVERISTQGGTPLVVAMKRALGQFT